MTGISVRSRFVCYRSPQPGTGARFNDQNVDRRHFRTTTLEKKFSFTYGKVTSGQKVPANGRPKKKKIDDVNCRQCYCFK